MTIHALKRAKERYKADFNFDDIGQIIKLIQEEKAKFVRPEGKCSVWKLRYKSKLIFPVVTEDFVIVTFKPDLKSVPKFKDPDGVEKQKRLKRAK